MPDVIGKTGRTAERLIVSVNVRHKKQGLKDANKQSAENFVCCLLITIFKCLARQMKKKDANKVRVGL